MKFMKKNQVVIYVIALMLIVAGYLNFTADGDFRSAVQTASSEEELNKMANIGDAQLVSSNVISDDYFSTSKLERDTMYSQMLETYEKVLNSNNSLETQKQSATDEIKKINDTKNSIMICENLIKTKGFKNSVIFVNGDSVSIVVKDEQLTTEKVAQIQNIVSREMNTKVENIHISSK